MATTTETRPPEAQQVAQALPPGWYQDPASRHAMRYWDGWRWTDHVGDPSGRGTDPLMAVPSQVAGPMVPPASPPISPERAGRRRHWGWWLVLGIAVLMGMGAIIDGIQTATEDSSSPAERTAADRAAAQARAKRAERGLYTVLVRSRSRTAANVSEVSDDMAPSGDVPTRIRVTVFSGAYGDAGAIAESEARDATRSIRIERARLIKSWRSRADDLRLLRPASLRARYTRAYRAQLRYLKDAGLFTGAGAAFLDGWNRITYVQQRYLISGKWERYKQLAPRAERSEKASRKALSQAHKAYRRSVTRR